MKIYSFPRGGLSFEDTTAPSRETSAIAFLPVVSVFPLTQYSSGHVYQVVSAGDMVREGMLIGRAAGSGAANVHATVPGRVVRNTTWKNKDGHLIDALIIRMEGSFDRLGKREEIFPWAGMGSYDLQRVIGDYGVVEMEGSGQPVSEMISAFRNAPEPLTLVVRCVFDDPWLAADYTLCKERLKAVVEGSFIMARAGGRVSRIVFAVSSGERDLGAALLEEASGGEIPAHLVLTGSRYPQRNRRELELVLRNYEKKENLNLGSLLVLGPATLAAAHDAIKLKKPVLDRYVAVGGQAVKKPQVLKVRVGTRLAEVFAECGGFIDTPKSIVVGSPLSGRTVTDLNEPVLKTSYAVFASLKTGLSDQRNCISCGECRAVCPVGLDPEELYKQAINAGMPEVSACHGCGCCEVVCPSRLPLSRVISEKSQGGNHG
ncbi:MAG TPA: 4Fe-4S ferredoxin [Treponema sp.]|nr:4Fe-4S ferredoxin [Treponema sp.]